MDLVLEPITERAHRIVRDITLVPAEVDNQKEGIEEEMKEVNKEHEKDKNEEENILKERIDEGVYDNPSSISNYNHD